MGDSPSGETGGLTYPLPAGMSETAVEGLLYRRRHPSKTQRPEPDWASVHRELPPERRRLDLLWQEYKGEHPDGYQYSSFCDHYRVWAGRLSVSLRQTHAPARNCFVDYAGPTVPVTEPLGRAKSTGCHLRRRSRRLELHLLRCHLEPDPAGLDGQPCPRLEFFGGVPAVLVPDNLKSGVNKACFLRPRTQSQLS